MGLLFPGWPKRNSSHSDIDLSLPYFHVVALGMCGIKQNLDKTACGVLLLRRTGSGIALKYIGDVTLWIGPAGGDDIVGEAGARLLFNGVDRCYNVFAVAPEPVACARLLNPEGTSYDEQADNHDEDKDIC